MGTIAESLQTKKAETVDDHFCAQLLGYLKAIPDSMAKDQLKMKFLQEAVELKHSSV